MGQGSIFDMGGDDVAAGSQHPPVSEVEFEQKEVLALEKETLGTFLSSHPLDGLREAIAGRVRLQPRRAQGQAGRLLGQGRRDHHRVQEDADPVRQHDGLRHPERHRGRGRTDRLQGGRSREDAARSSPTRWSWSRDGSTRRKRAPRSWSRERSTSTLPRRRSSGPSRSRSSGRAVHGERADGSALARRPRRHQGDPLQTTKATPSSCSRSSRTGRERHLKLGPGLPGAPVARSEDRVRPALRPVRPRSGSMSPGAGRRRLSRGRSCGDRVARSAGEVT